MLQDPRGFQQPERYENIDLWNLEYFITTPVPQTIIYFGFITNMFRMTQSRYCGLLCPQVTLRRTHSRRQQGIRERRTEPNLLVCPPPAWCRSPFTNARERNAPMRQPTDRHLRAPRSDSV
ncbi:hypothetical protein WISP_150323 [Willisornis vidua]|uniref:Uncharacterized protein n=1 Tax=Willisornis vidua TaxID=1566151 RepID=A0ABQ9CMB8_9PASS|nr:hypothetical protein WISP_150323 [Willisornis vidua]